MNSRWFACGLAPQRTTLVFLSLGLGLSGLTGCPLPPGDDTNAPLKAEITISTTRGAAPLAVVVSAEASRSRNGQITGYSWDFGGQASASSMSASHTFNRPGRYAVKLTVTDSAGQTASTRVDVRVAGESASAIIIRDTGSGVAPLTVRFDGTRSSARDDVIQDYFWDFDDGEESRSPTPQHRFRFAGTYTVTLRVISAGGVEASATSTIVVSPPPASQPTTQPTTQPANP